MRRAIERAMSQTMERERSDLPPLGKPRQPVWFSGNLQENRSVSGSSVSRPRRPVLDKYEQLVGQVLSVIAGEKAKVVLFTAAEKGEGTSTTVGHVAQSLCMKSRWRVLLIDADLREPRLHEWLAIDRAPGLTDMLEAEEVIGGTVMSYVVKVPIGNLSVLPSGTHHPQPSLLLTSGAMALVLDRAKQEFDYVLIDSSPVLSAADTAMLAANADGVVLVIEAGKTRAPVARDARTQLEARGGRVVGVVLNKRRYHIPGFLYRLL